MTESILGRVKQILAVNERDGTFGLGFSWHGKK
jgi:hypothetical protein